MSTQADLAALKERVKSNSCAKLGYEQLKKSKYVDLSRAHTPYTIVYVVGGKRNKYEDAFRGDAHAAHATALMWVITEDARYRNKAVSILNDWAARCKRVKVKPGSRQSTSTAYLEAAWAAPVWTAAADIIRYYNDGAARWRPERIAAFDRFLNHLVRTARRTRYATNNWGTSAVLAILAAAVYQENAAAYAEAIDLHKRLLRSVSRKSGALRRDYLRDPWHPQYTLHSWIHTCEIAWNQGDDLYGIRLDGQSLPRLAVCLEHFSKLFLGALPNPKGLKRGNYRNSHRGRQSYEMAFNHFIRRKGMASSMPAFARMVPAWRPGGIDNHFLAWDTLTHGALSDRSQADGKYEQSPP
jgi:hypothetical protein